MESNEVVPQNILIISETAETEALALFIKVVEEKSNGKICTKQLVDVRNMETNGKDEKCTYDWIYSGVSTGICHDDTLLLKLLALLKPAGRAVLRQVLERPDFTAVAEFQTQLKLLGYVAVAIQRATAATDAGVLEIRCEKPHFEVGSSCKLQLPAKVRVWTLTADADADVIDPDTLLDADDLARPASAALRVCATTGKRKACKDCSCGLAEELDTVVKPASSSCGNCYLGDAFRCSSCPYLGMPAFKSGEKVLLTDALLQPDL